MIEVTFDSDAMGFPTKQDKEMYIDLINSAFTEDEKLKNNFEVKVYQHLINAVGNPYKITVIKKTTGNIDYELTQKLQKFIDDFESLARGGS